MEYAGRVGRVWASCWAIARRRGQPAMVNSESNLCPTLRPTRQQFERPFRDYVREQFLKHPEWACFKVRSWPTRAPDALSRHDAGFVAARPHVRSSSFAWHRSSLPNVGHQTSGASMTWTRSGSQLPSGSMCAWGGQSPVVVEASRSCMDWACDRAIAAQPMHRLSGWCGLLGAVA